MGVHKHELYNNMVFYGPGNKIIHYKGLTFVNINRKEQSNSSYHSIIIKDSSDDFYKFSKPKVVRIEAKSQSTGQLNILFPHKIMYKDDHLIIMTSNINVKKNEEEISFDIK